MTKFKGILFVFSLAYCLWGFAQNPFGASQPTNWSGTGWLLSNDYVVTNHHVIDGARTIVLKFPNEEGQWREFRGEVVVSDEECDLAILRILDVQSDDFEAVPYSLRTTLADVGESVFALGYPLTTTMGEEIKLTTGIISSHSGFQGSTMQYQISVPIQPGNSGGPVFDDNGNVIGIVCAKHTGAENVSYAVKASYLQPLINQLSNASQILTSQNQLSGMNLPEKVKHVKGFVCYIECSSRSESPRSTNPKYGAPVIPQGSKVIENPDVDSQRNDMIRIDRITITDSETIVECSFIASPAMGEEGWISIHPETYIDNYNQQYTIIKADGIAFLPDQTPLLVNETKHFTLIFPAIPKGTTSISLIEPGNSNWQFYGISLK